ERLDDVPVDPRLDRLDDIFLLGDARDHEHGELAVGRARSDRPHGVRPARGGHGPIRNDEIDGFAGELGERRLAVARFDDGVESHRRQMALDDPPHRSRVVNDEDFHRVRPSAESCKSRTRGANLANISQATRIIHFSTELPSRQTGELISFGPALVPQGDFKCQPDYSTSGREAPLPRPCWRTGCAVSLRLASGVGRPAASHSHTGARIAFSLTRSYSTPATASTRRIRSAARSGSRRSPAASIRTNCSARWTTERALPIPPTILKPDWWPLRYAA